MIPQQKIIGRLTKIPTTIKIKIDGKTFTVPIPKESGVAIRDVQDKNCNAKGSMCALYNNQLVCWKIGNLKSNKNGDLELGDMVACRKADSPKIKIET